jgi:hypothetical protein
MKIIHIYFNSGSELMTSVTEDEAKELREDISYRPDCILLPKEDKYVYIPVSSIERLEIQK